MGHDTHFLKRLERTNAAQTDFALALYRDSAAVRYVMGRVRLPADAQRIAIALEDADSGPHLVVTRNGDFVTCLGPGMSLQDKPRIPFGQCRALFCEYQQGNERMAQALALARDETLSDLIERLVKRGNELTREEFVAVSALQPVLQIEFIRNVYHFNGILNKLRPVLIGERRVSPRIHDALRYYWRALHAIGHFLLLACMNGYRGLESLFAMYEEKFATMPPNCRPHVFWIPVRQGDSVLTARALWCIGRIGKPLLAHYKHVYRHTETPLEFFEAAAGLTIIGLRHRRLAEEARKALLSRRAWSPALLDRIHSNYETLFTHLLGALFSPEESYKRSIQYCRETVHHALERFPDFESPDVWRSAGPEGIPIDAAAAITVNIPHDTMNNPSAQIHLALLLPWLSRCEAQDLYLPEALAKQVVHWNPEFALKTIRRWHKFYGRDKPVQRNEPPGRNTVCPCGSGKKYKHCCLRQGITSWPTEQAPTVRSDDFSEGEEPLAAAENPADD